VPLISLLKGEKKRNFFFSSLERTPPERDEGCKKGGCPKKKKYE
jgi:hypothetical protein